MSKNAEHVCLLGFLTFLERFEMPSSYFWALGAAYFMFVINLITRTKNTSEIGGD